MTPTGNPNVTVLLSELNQLIAEQKGISVDDLAIRDGSVNDNVRTNKKVDEELDATIDVPTISGKTINVNVPSGTQSNTILSCRGEGLPNMRSKIRGPLLIKINVNIPRNLTDKQIHKIQQLRDGVE